MALEKNKGKLSPVKAPVQVVEYFGRFTPPVGTGPVSGSNDVLHGCNVNKLNTNHTYEVIFDWNGQPVVTPVFFDVRTVHTGSTTSDWKAFVLRQSNTGSQFILMNSGSAASNVSAPDSVLFRGVVKVGV